MNMGKTNNDFWIERLCGMCSQRAVGEQQPLSSPPQQPHERVFILHANNEPLKSMLPKNNRIWGEKQTFLITAFNIIILQIIVVMPQKSKTNPRKPIFSFPTIFALQCSLLFFSWQTLSMVTLQIPFLLKVSACSCWVLAVSSGALQPSGEPLVR